jgi:Brp/Blh family beta-carotene 15,15'-monooxygenase
MAVHLSPPRVHLPGAGAPARGLSGPRGHRDAPARFAVAVRAAGVVATLALLVADGVAPGAVQDAGVALALVGIVLGIPHGAVDHLVPFWAHGRRVRVRPLARGLAGYVATGAVALAAVLLAPLPVTWLFLLVSAVHFGRGEVVVQAELAGRRPPGPWQDVLPAAAHGAAVVALPLTLHRDVALRVLDRVAPGFGTTPGGLLDALAVVTAVLVVAALARLLATGRAAEGAELALLALLFAVVPATAAFGVYFGLWHAARHTLRLVLLPGADGQVPAVGAGLRRYARGAALPSLVAVGLLWVVSATANPSVLAAALVTLVALTAPHLVVVGALDRAVRSRPSWPAPARQPVPVRPRRWRSPAGTR